MGNQSKIEIILTAVDKGLTSGFQRAMSSLKGLVSGSKQADSGVRNLTASVSGLVGSLLATVSVAAGMQKLVGVSREFDKISAGLITATGTIEGSEQAFAAVQEFATSTPYDLAQVTDSFIKLVNYGLDPSEKALTSYGNTSSALGKDLNQMIEAVADAATGEFERLKEFGIKAKSEGDNVSFTFRGVTTTVKKNSQEIEQYLIKLGETNFGDAMANRMQTLDGALSNLGDEWNKVFLNISKAGIGNIIADGVRIAIDALGELNAMVASGELVAYLRAQVGHFAGWAEDVKSSISLVGKFYDDHLQQLEGGGKKTVTFLIDAFRLFPENVRAFIGLMVVDVAAGLDRVRAYAVAFKDGIAAVFNSQTISGVGKQLENELGIIKTARNESIDAILSERQAAIDSTEGQIAASKKLRAEYDAKQAAAKTDTTDKLDQFKIQGEAEGKSAASAKTETAARRSLAAETKKAAVEAKKLYEQEKKIASEKLRAASQEKILGLELEKLEASKLPTALARAEAELAIDRRVMAERIELKRQEIAALKAMAGVDPAEIIRSESELSGMRVDAAKNDDSGLRSIASTRLTEVEDAWRRGTLSVQEYQQAVKDATEAGAIYKEEADRRMILSGDNMTDALKLGFSDWAATVQTDAEFAANATGQVINAVVSGFGNIVSSWENGTKAAKDAMLDLARSTLQMVAQMIAQQLLYNAVKVAGSAFGFGMADGGPVQQLAGGGMVGGWSPHKKADNVPIWATAREFMQPVDAVDYYGLSFMESIRRRAFPRNLAHALAGNTLPRVPSSYRLAEGGQVPGAPQQTTLKSGDTRLRVINVLDKNMVGDFLGTADGETAIINMIRRNGTTIRTLIGG